jgi:hypothetical protein
MLKRLLARSVSFAAAMFCMGMALSVASAWAANTCPNETLRSELHSGQLPDCRAYEMVSPTYTEGTILASFFAASPEGSRTIVGSLGTFAGSEQVTLSNANVDGAAYLLSRTSTGWAASSLDPSSSEYRGHGGILAASTDLNSSLWMIGTQRQPEKTLDLYLERPLGTFTEIGSPTPESDGPNDTGVSAEFKYLGASETLSHVLFWTTAGFRWPFDATVSEGGTVYEYTRAEQQPMLVGVEGGRGSTVLISHCGTRLGSGSFHEGAREKRLGLAEGAEDGSMYNAISAKGTRIFFTAVGTEATEAGECKGPRVSELYAREESPVAGEEVSAANVRTVAISEPSKEDCGTCLTDEASRAAATFQGASLDGSKVFFTTEQELLPGAQGNNLYEYNFNAPTGKRITRLSQGAPIKPEVQGVARISEDGSHVYFVAKGALTDEANSAGDMAIEREDNLYMYSDEGIAFVATLASGDSADWARADARPVMASDEGRFLVFTSEADLTNEDTSTDRSQVFQYDADTKTLVRASVGQEGYNDDGKDPVGGSTIANGFPQSYSYVIADSPTSASGGEAPADGAVFFQSPDALTPQALDDVQVGDNSIENVYEYHEGHVYLLSDGRDASIVNAGPGTYLAGSDPSGGDVFFFSSDPLIPADGNTQQDLYDARIEGGFPNPLSSTMGCAGEVCQGGLTGAPALPQVGGSATQIAEDYPPQAMTYPTSVTIHKVSPKSVKCKKGFVKRQGKCVRLRSERKAKKSNRESKR